MTTVTINTKIFISDGGEPENFTQVFGFAEYNGVDSAKEAVDVTALDDEHQALSVATPDAQDFDLTFNYKKDDEGQKLLRAAALGNDTRKFKIEYTSGVAQTFSLLLLGINRSATERKTAERFVLKAKKIGATVTMEQS